MWWRPLVRFGIIGCGVIGGLHAQTVTGLGDRAELAVVADTSPDRARQLAEKHGVEASHSIGEVLARPDIDAVTICTPSGQHADLAVAALDAGKHVVIEKPLDITLGAARRVLAAERRSDRTAMVISQFRYEQASTVVHEALQAGRFGKLTSGNAIMSWWRSQEYYDSGDWRGTWEFDGGGALMNQGIHTIDLLVWFLGEPVEVFAYADCLAHERIEVEDTAVATIQFAGGALGVVHGTTAAYPGPVSRVQVHGDRGSAVIDNDELVYFHAAGGGGREYPYGAGGEANQAGELLGGAGSRRRSDATSHTAQFEDFLSAVEEGRPPLVTVEAATRPLALIRAIYESARTRRPVKIKELGQ
ncbi:Gfo/Idh/MocA family oxidoreductase [Streptomyces sp. B-S-A12]|uniref:Gfo/Idh/MocA family oxidoreductase n=1 Tax=Streptomyces luteolus TaxID=3043615 RepID=A0ABT6SUG6_9ACTN|nr:Gfo/Idh/MocA family oxidoreductase [Streptomyces sp. B-S-A12]MDI3418733.1 Gfo/Idh/MocA family oxidoreductase [Streptomyces sp. B-S-A12]